MELDCRAQNYAWGVPGIESSVAQLLKNANNKLEIYENKPYAELWMGTHVNAPSIIKESGITLSSYIEEFPNCLGSNITNQFGNELCYLFKVLSVNQALSIQAHPEKEHAERLHSERPEIYKDPNHKPEMALALTNFEALCGFRPAKEIKSFFSEIPALKSLVGEENATIFTKDYSEENLKKCFSSLMIAPKDKIHWALSETQKQLNSLDDCDSIRLLKNLFLTLLSQYPGDAGCFSIYLLNYIILQPGEALFLGPNVIHAYLKGDCIECMACSDNVVRAGLTPKFQDVDVLLNMLEYKMTPAEERKFIGKSINDSVTLFNPPVPDFAVQKIQTTFPKQILLSKEASASIMIIVKGIGSNVSVLPPNFGSVKPPTKFIKGTVLFISANQVVSFEADKEFLAFRAFCL